jgi:class 3 adenylate cyclase
MTLGSSADSIMPGPGIHWVRYHVLLDTALNGTPLLLNVSSDHRVDVYLNGRHLMRNEAMRMVRPGSGGPLSDTIPRLSLPVTFACDGQPEVLAIRLTGLAGEALSASGLRVTLHELDSGYILQRSLLHFGVFLGINAIILLLALVIWSFDRRDRSWLLLALLSLVSAVRTFCEVGGSDHALGLSDGLAKALELIDIILLPWSMYLLIMVLWVMQGYLSRLRIRLYTAGVLVVTLICIAFSVAMLLGEVSTEKGLTFANFSLAFITSVIILGMLFVLVQGWFVIEVVRLGIKLLRTKGSTRWIGAGALASSLLSLVFWILGELSGVGLAPWLDAVGDYCSYVAVPVSVAVYLAIRSAHHNKLVTRQRDDLDLEVKERTAQLSAEKERSDELLLNILPAEVAEELKRTGEAAARHFDQASVLFTDFKGFTEMSEQVGAGELLQELNTCFKAFDEIIGARGVEKIKTIGDAYMCVGGLPDPRSSAPVDVVLAALEMQTFMKMRQKERQAKGQLAFVMRVGIHTGPVVAGIVGVKKFQYDIWGDTVNTASRMESSGEVGQVNISESTYALVKDEPGLVFTPRGKVQAKGKGEMEMYFVANP